MSRSKIPEAVQNQVRQRANYLCESCHALEFNPRQSPWSQHFIWSASGLLILGLTPTGRATVVTLDLNRDRVLNIRAADQEIGRHPPLGDPRQSSH